LLFFAVKDGCVKDKSSKKSKKTKEKAGRKKGSKNKNLKDIELSPYLLFVQQALISVLNLIGRQISLIYFVYDGAFGNNGAVQMILRAGLHVISKLQKNSALFFPYAGEQKGVGAPKKYGEQLDYYNIPNTYLKENSINKNIETKIFQMNLIHKKFADMLNVVITIKRNIETNKSARMILFSTDLDLDYKKLIPHHS
jgi:putative transposase